MNGLPLLLLIFWLLPPPSAKRTPIVCVLANIVKIREDYSKPGDFSIGGNLLLLNIMSYHVPDFKTEPSQIPKTLL